MDTASKNKLAKVHPELAQRITDVIAYLADTGIEVRVVQGMRTFDEQNALYAKGRTKPGSKVTNARGGYSNHNYGLAVDLCPFKNGEPQWNDQAGFNAIGSISKKFGLEWGGDWKKLVDKPHVQLPGMTVEQCRNLYQGGGGLNAVWQRMDAVLDKTPHKETPDRPVLQNGSEGDLVKLLQCTLLLPVDGVFGPKTESAVKAFQKQKGLTADGKVGAKTYKALGL